MLHRFSVSGLAIVTLGLASLPLISASLCPPATASTENIEAINQAKGSRSQLLAQGNRRAGSGRRAHVR
jgi:hypothetical protein